MILRAIDAFFQMRVVFCRESVLRSEDELFRLTQCFVMRLPTVVSSELHMIKIRNFKCSFYQHKGRLSPTVEKSSLDDDDDSCQSVKETWSKL